MEHFISICRFNILPFSFPLLQVNYKIRNIVSCAMYSGILLFVCFIYSGLYLLIPNFRLSLPLFPCGNCKFVLCESVSVL